MKKFTEKGICDLCGDRHACADRVTREIEYTGEPLEQEWVAYRLECAARSLRKAAECLLNEMKENE